MKCGKYTKFFAVLLIVFLTLAVIYVIVQNRTPKHKQGPVGIACINENDRLDEGELCCLGYTEKINTNGSHTCTSTKIYPEYTCLQDDDCGLNICDCKSMNNKYIKPVQKACMRLCNGIPKCVNGMCSLIN